MKNLSLVASVLVLAIGGAAMPAMAAPETTSNVNPGYCDTTENLSKNLDQIGAMLHEQGVNASSIDVWGNCIRAYVTNADGKTSMVYFDPDTLQQIGGDTVKNAG